jgi:hypothetical protein
MAGSREADTIRAVAKNTYGAVVVAKIDIRARQWT